MGKRHLVAALLWASLTAAAQQFDISTHNYIGARDRLRQSTTFNTDVATSDTRAWQNVLATGGSGGMDKGLAAVKEYLANWPAGAYRVQAQLLLASYVVYDNPSQALAIYDSIGVTALAPDNRPEYEYGRGFAFVLLGDYESAKRCMTQALKDASLQPDAHFFLGYCDYANHNYASALKQFELAKECRMSHVDLPLYTAAVLYAAGRPAEAVATVEPLLNNNKLSESQRVEALRLAGESAFAAGQKEKAMSRLTEYEALASNPSRTALYILGTARAAKGLNSEAVKALRPVAEDTSDAMGQSAWLYIGQALNAMGDDAPALMAFERAMRLDHDPGVQEAAFYNYAVLKFRGARSPFASSAVIFEEFLKKFPTGQYAPMVQEYLVNGYLTDNDYAGALESINRMTQPTAPVLAAKQQVLYALGTQMLAKGDAAKSLELLDEAKALSKQGDAATAARVELSRGEALYALGRLPEAGEALNAYLSQAPANDSGRALALYDLAYVQMGLKDYKQAISTLERLMRSSGSLSQATMADARSRLGDAMLYTGNLSGASEQYNLAVKAQPDAADYPMFQLGVVEGFRDRPVKKIEALAQMIESFPNSPLVPDALLETTEAYIRQGREDRALDVYADLVSRFPATEQGRRGALQMALTRLNSGDRSGAIEGYKSVVTHYPTSEEARMAVDELKRLAAQDGSLPQTAAWLARIDDAPQLDIAQADALSFQAAEEQWLVNGKTGLLQRYLTDYPKGASRAQALAYMMDEATTNDATSDALTFASEIADHHPDSRLAEQAIVVKAGALHELGRGAEALESYKLLAGKASSPERASEANLGLMRVAVDLGDYSQALRASEAILGSSAADPAARSEAQYTKALALNCQGNVADARSIWSELASDPSVISGAKSAVALAESLLAEGEAEKARQTAEALIDSSTPHTYWLARAFIVLSDAYAAQGRDFEAREYLLSLRDNYPGSESDIFQMIETRLKK